MYSAVGNMYVKFGYKVFVLLGFAPEVLLLPYFRCRVGSLSARVRLT
jgi:hypothetical protein